MHTNRQVGWSGWLLLIALGATVLAFMGLSLAITTTGTARFAVAMGYSEMTGYAVGGVFDFAKAVLPVALLALLAKRGVGPSALLGIAWLGLVTYSALATHATVRTAIDSIERNGTWKTQTRSGVTAELTLIEQRLAALSGSAPPRPSNSLREALEAEKVPPGVWRDSQECGNIRDSRYFQAACAKVLELRRELAAAEDYERLETRARDLRQTLAATPIVATSDPLPTAFTATLGHFLPLEGRVGVALLLTLVVEIMSCFGLAALSSLAKDKGRGAIACGIVPQRSLVDEGMLSGSAADKALHEVPAKFVPTSSLTAASKGGRDKKAELRSNVLPMPTPRAREGGRAIPKATPPRGGLSLVGSHIPEFARHSLQHAAGRSLAASDIWTAYEAWCAARDLAPLSRQRLGLELTALGFARRKSCGLIRYRDLQLAA